jgi:hypothetical protein
VRIAAWAGYYLRRRTRGRSKTFSGKKKADARARPLSRSSAGD